MVILAIYKIIIISLLSKLESKRPLKVPKIHGKETSLKSNLSRKKTTKEVITNQKGTRMVNQDKLTKTGQTKKFVEKETYQPRLGSEGRSTSCLVISLQLSAAKQVHI